MLVYVLLEVALKFCAIMSSLLGDFVGGYWLGLEVWCCDYLWGKFVYMDKYFVFGFYAD